MAQKLAVDQSKLVDVQEKIAQRDLNRKEIKAKIKKIEDSLADQNKAMEIEEMRLRNEKAVISHEKKPLTQLESQLSNEHYRSDLDLKSLKLKPKECPTCKKPWDKGPSDSDIEKATGKVTESVGKLKEIRTKIEEVNLREEAKQAEIDEQQKRQRQLNVKDQVKGFSSEFDSLDKLDNKAASECTNLSVQIALLNKGPSDVGVVKAQGILDSKNASLVEYEDKVAVTTLELEENKQLCQVVEYWSGAFNSSGIPNMVLSRSVDPLNQVSMALSHRMSGGTLGISYETTKELSSGAEKNCLNIRVKNSRGASRVTGNSKGESGLTNLIVAETITEVGRVSSRIGFRWYDEVVNSQDPKVRRCILSYLKETAQRLGILIFVVDHHPEVSNYADHVLRATKSKEGVTTFSWV
jgi:DNA repair exonuclease SbcCD ATPase subunit